ncbi:hypothetical protein PHISP_05278 [Aspergillus sp. HF37]|nr:hypothetical protein PHISP_05278 [Aspergillus sp. HF37]
METAVYTEPLEPYTQFYDPWAADDRLSPATAAVSTMKKSGTAMSCGNHRTIQIYNFPDFSSSSCTGIIDSGSGSSSRSELWPGSASGSGSSQAPYVGCANPKSVVQPKPYRFVLPPAQAGVILQAWEGGPVDESDEEEEEFVSVCSDCYEEEEEDMEEEMVDNTTSTTSTSSSAIGAIRVQELEDSEEEEEDEVQISGPRMSRFIEHINGNHAWTPVDGEEVLGITGQEKEKGASRLAGVVRSRVVEARDRCLMAGRRLKGRWKTAL